MWEFWGLLLLSFFFPKKVLKSLPLLCSAFSWQYVRTTECDHFGNASITSVGAAHGGSWFQLTPSSCQLNVPQRWWKLYCSNSLWDQCCCWLAILPACLKSQTWILLGRGDWGICERLGKMVKILLICMTLYRFLLFYSGLILLREGYLKWVCASPVEYSHPSTQELLFLVYFYVLLLLRHPP